MRNRTLADLDRVVALGGEAWIRTRPLLAFFIRFAPDRHCDYHR